MILLLFGPPRKNRQIRYSYIKKEEEENLCLNPIPQLLQLGNWVQRKILFFFFSFYVTVTNLTILSR